MIAIDPGFGALKFFADNGRSGEIVAHVVPAAQSVDWSALGMERGPKATLIENSIGRFWTGINATEYGESKPRNDFEKLAGSPEVRALVYSAFTEGQITGEHDVLLALPMGVAMGQGANERIAEIKGWLIGAHSWTGNGHKRVLSIPNVRVLSQVQAAFMDYALTAKGQDAEDLAGEIGVISIGHNTIELAVWKDGKIAGWGASGEREGVRNLLGLVRNHGMKDYSIAELDRKLRDGALDVSASVEMWRSTIAGLIDQTWNGRDGRFTRIVAVGGGVQFADAMLIRRYTERLFVPRDATMAVCRGLVKLSRRGK